MPTDFGWIAAPADRGRLGAPCRGGACGRRERDVVTCGHPSTGGLGRSRGVDLSRRPGDRHGPGARRCHPERPPLGAATRRRRARRAGHRGRGGLLARARPSLAARLPTAHRPCPEQPWRCRRGRFRGRRLGPPRGGRAPVLAGDRSRPQPSPARARRTGPHSRPSTRLGGRRRDHRGRGSARDEPGQDRGGRGADSRGPVGARGDGRRPGARGPAGGSRGRPAPVRPGSWKSPGGAGHHARRPAGGECPGVGRPRRHADAGAARAGPAGGRVRVGPAVPGGPAGPGVPDGRRGRRQGQVRGRRGRPRAVLAGEAPTGPPAGAGVRGRTVRGCGLLAPATLGAVAAARVPPGVPAARARATGHRPGLPRVPRHLAHESA